MNIVLVVINVALLVIIAAGVILYKRRPAATDTNQKTELTEIEQENTGMNYTSLTEEV